MADLNAFMPLRELSHAVAASRSDTVSQQRDNNARQATAKRRQMRNGTEDARAEPAPINEELTRLPRLRNTGSQSRDTAGGGGTWQAAQYPALFEWSVWRSHTKAKYVRYRSEDKRTS